MAICYSWIRVIHFVGGMYACCGGRRNGFKGVKHRLFRDAPALYAVATHCTQAPAEAVLATLEMLTFGNFQFMASVIMCTDICAEDALTFRATRSSLLDRCQLTEQTAMFAPKPFAGLNGSHSCLFNEREVTIIFLPAKLTGVRVIEREIRPGLPIFEVGALWRYCLDPRLVSDHFSAIFVWHDTTQPAVDFDFSLYAFWVRELALPISQPLLSSRSSRPGEGHSKYEWGFDTFVFKRDRATGVEGYYLSDLAAVRTVSNFASVYSSEAWECVWPAFTSTASIDLDSLHVACACCIVPPRNDVLLRGFADGVVPAPLISVVMGAGSVTSSIAASKRFAPNSQKPPLEACGSSAGIDSKKQECHDRIRLRAGRGRVRYEVINLEPREIAPGSGRFMPTIRVAAVADINFDDKEVAKSENSSAVLSSRFPLKKA